MAIAPAAASESTRRVIIKEAKAMLALVGQMPSKLEEYPVSIHYRKAITDEEWKGLPAEWCAIPAVHEAGRGIILEENT
jgi:hypothetical protein